MLEKSKLPVTSKITDSVKLLRPELKTVSDSDKTDVEIIQQFTFKLEQGYCPYELMAVINILMSRFFRKIEKAYGHSYQAEIVSKVFQYQKQYVQDSLQRRITVVEKLVPGVTYLFAMDSAKGLRRHSFVIIEFGNPNVEAAVLCDIFDFTSFDKILVTTFPKLN